MPKGHPGKPRSEDTAFRRCLIRLCNFVATYFLWQET